MTTYNELLSKYRGDLDSQGLGDFPEQTKLPPLHFRGVGELTRHVGRGSRPPFSIGEVLKRVEVRARGIIVERTVKNQNGRSPRLVIIGSWDLFAGDRVEFPQKSK